MTRQEQQRMLAALMASSASQPRFASVDFAGTPGLQALGAEQADIDRRRRSLFEPPVATSQQQLFPTLATHLVGAFQRNQEAADRTALLDQLPTPEITDADYEAYSSPYLAQTREAEQEAMSAPTDQGLGIDADDLIDRAALYRDDFPLEEISVPSNALGLDPAQLGTFQSQAGTADQYIDTPLGDDPRMMSALIGDPRTVGQEREQIAGDFALDQSSPRALLDRLGSVETKTRSGRNLKEQMMTNALVQDAAATREAALLADKRAYEKEVADRLAASRLAEVQAEITGRTIAAQTKARATKTADDVKAAAKIEADKKVADARVEAALLQTYNNEMAQIREPYQKLGIPYPDTLSYEQWKMARNGEAPQLDSGETQIAGSNLVTSAGVGENTLPDLATAAQALIDKRTPPDSKPKAAPQSGTPESLQAAQLRTARLKREGIETEKSNREFLDNADAILVGGQRLLRQLENIVPPMKNDDGTPMYKQNPRTGLKELVPNINKEHPGLQNATGVRGLVGGALFQNLPFVSDDSAIQGTNAADFIAARNQIGGSAFMQAYDALKGGGHISDAEGEKATAAILNLDANQSEKEFRRTVLTLYEEVKKAYTSAEQRKDRLNKYYGNRGVQ